jgi:hypothetical protein
MSARRATAARCDGRHRGSTPACRRASRPSSAASTRHGTRPERTQRSTTHGVRRSRQIVARNSVRVRAPAHGCGRDSASRILAPVRPVGARSSAAWRGPETERRVVRVELQVQTRSACPRRLASHTMGRIRPSGADPGVVRNARPSPGGDPAGRPAHDVERGDEAERAAVGVVGRRGHLIVDGVAPDSDLRESLADHGIEHLRRHAVLVACDGWHLGEADDGYVAMCAHRRLMNVSSGASGSPVGRK